MEKLRGIIGLCLMVTVFFFWLRDHSQIRLFASLAILFPFCCPLLVFLWGRLPLKKTSSRLVALLGLLILFIAIDARADADEQSLNDPSSEFYSCNHLKMNGPEDGWINQMAFNISTLGCPDCLGFDEKLRKTVIKTAFNDNGVNKDWFFELRDRISEKDPFVEIGMRITSKDVVEITARKGGESRVFRISADGDFSCQRRNWGRVKKIQREARK